MNTVVSAVDLVPVSRAVRLMRENPAAIQGLLTADERSQWRGPRRIAEVIAAKEAVLKALGEAADEVNWLDIEVTRSPLQVHIGEKLRALSEKVPRWHVTTAASHTLAVAWVIAGK